jgi:hypothetical protein
MTGPDSIFELAYGVFRVPIEADGRFVEAAAFIARSGESSVGRRVSHVTRIMTRSVAQWCLQGSSLANCSG